jgi:hypothetical protein
VSTYKRFGREPLTYRLEVAVEHGNDSLNWQLVGGVSVGLHVGEQDRQLLLGARLLFQLIESLLGELDVQGVQAGASKAQIVRGPSLARQAQGGDRLGRMVSFCSLVFGGEQDSIPASTCAR